MYDREKNTASKEKIKRNIVRNKETIQMSRLNQRTLHLKASSLTTELRSQVSSSCYMNIIIRMHMFCGNTHPL